MSGLFAFFLLTYCAKKRSNSGRQVTVDLELEIVGEEKSLRGKGSGAQLLEEI